jgi:hypothetical protein
MCECYKVDGTPALHNNRAAAVPVFEAVKDHLPWFGLEQVREDNENKEKDENL